MLAVLNSYGCPLPCFTLDLLSMETSRCYCWLFPLSLQSCSPGLEYPSSITFHHVTLLSTCRLSPKPSWHLIPILPVNQCLRPPSTHTHRHTHTLSHSLMLLKPEINYTPCQSFLYYVPAILSCSWFLLTLLHICHQVLAIAWMTLQGQRFQ